MKILTLIDHGMDGFHGEIGTPTNMFDSFGEPLSIGDVVITSNQDKFSKQNKYLGNEYGIAFVCEENTNIANFTEMNHQYIMGIASTWDSKVFENHPINFDHDSEYWYGLYNLMDGWIVHKIKDHKDVVIGEHIEYLYVKEIE